MTDVGMALATDAEAPSPLSEDGADSAIAIHSTGSGPDALEGRRRGSLSTPKGATEAPAIPAADAGGGTDSTEPRRTLHGPTVEAAGDARSSYLSGVAVRELRLMHALAVARLSLSDDPATFIEAACAVADLFPVMTCLGCGKTFVPVYRRQTKFCSDRCRYRIGMRNRRRRLAAEAGTASPPPSTRRARVGGAE